MLDRGVRFVQEPVPDLAVQEFAGTRHGDVQGFAPLVVAIDAAGQGLGGWRDADGGCREQNHVRSHAEGTPARYAPTSEAVRLGPGFPLCTKPDTAQVHK